MKVKAIAMVSVAAFTAALILSGPAEAVDQGKARYIGGTLKVKEKSEGAIDLKDEEVLFFMPKDSRDVEIRWKAIKEVEYGQKVGRRVAMAILVSPVALFSKARRHYVTISWEDKSGTEQAAVLEFDKNDIRSVLAIFKARTGKEIVMQDEEAQKQMGGGRRSDD